MLIKLQRQNDFETILINPDNVTAIVPIRNYSRVVFADNEYVEVAERVEEIYGLIASKENE